MSNQHLEQRVADQVGEIERMSSPRRFLPPQVADRCLWYGEGTRKSPSRDCRALVHLRGFTGFTESADGEDVIALLREYRAAVIDVNQKKEGTLCA